MRTHTLDRKLFKNSAFLCPNCRKVWQFVPGAHGGGLRIIKTKKGKRRPIEYLDDFPKYGLEKITCKKCKGV